MKQNNFGELIFSEDDICDLLMQGRNVDSLKHVVVDPGVNLEELAMHVESPESLLTWTFPYDSKTSVPEFHASQQLTWHMPEEYKQLDIEAWLKKQCPPWDPESTRLDEELAEYKARNMLDLLRWLKYFVDVCSKEGVVWPRIIVPVYSLSIP